MAAARDCSLKGIRRFSLVASGRAVKGNALKSICALLNEAAAETGISTCASLGLLDRNDLQQLWDAGVRRYHCNLETAPSHFSTLCTTHTVEDKINTINAAREVGFEICSGGIIGMGETVRQRAEFALKLREIRPDSIPINILSPIPGTPLQDTEAISEDDILDTVALFRFVHPLTQLRFAGGRKRLSRKAQIEAMKIGINGGIAGDLLTTLGSTVTEDKALIDEAGYKL
jgi:biotin synthase